MASFSWATHFNDYTFYISLIFQDLPDDGSNELDELPDLPDLSVDDGIKSAWAASPPRGGYPVRETVAT